MKKCSVTVVYTNIYINKDHNRKISALYIRTSKNEIINFKNCTGSYFDTITNLTLYILKLLKNNNFVPAIIEQSEKSTLYDIIFYDKDNDTLSRFYY